MIELECPHCGGLGSAPREKVNTRLVCRKCHQIFHVTPTGRAVPGEPPLPKGADHGKGRGAATATAVKKKKRESSVELGGLSGANPGLLGVLGALVLVGVAYLGYSVIAGRGTPLLTPVANQFAEALRHDDSASIQLLAGPGSADDAASWYEPAKRVIDDVKKGAAASDLLVDAVVTDENPSGGTGQVQIFILPKKGASRNDQITREAGTAPGRALELTTFWTYVRGGWRFDPKRSMETMVGR
jgi:hypothetical protein